MNRMRDLPTLALGIGLWLPCVLWIGVQADAAWQRCIDIAALLSSSTQQTQVVGGGLGLRLYSTAHTDDRKQRVTTVAVDAAGCIRYAGATEAVYPSHAPITVHLRPVAPSDCMGERLP